MAEGEKRTILLVDGENLDATLGVQMLKRRPGPEERPRWERLLDYSQQQWDQPVTALFFLAVWGEPPTTFVQALMALGYRPVLLSGAENVKVVDVAIQRTLAALAQRRDDVVLVSHDGDFVPQVRALCDGRRIAVVGFAEFRSGGYAALAAPELEMWDLEYDVKAFNISLPRVRVIPIEAFDPLDFL
jgi:uncharacterized protein